jgi:hypothetical protein
MKATETAPRTRKRRADSGDTKVYPGVILDNGMYTLAEVRKRTGLMGKSLRTAKSQGLHISRIGNVRFILGRDLIEFLSKQNP